MANSVAEAYLLIVRSSLVPVVGEAVPHPFDGQIELDEWSWELKHDEKANDGKGGTTAPAPGATNESKSAANNDKLVRAIADIHKKPRLTEQERNRLVMAELKKAKDAQEKIDKEGGGTADKDKDKDDADDGGNKLNFTFRKGVDLASTQLLNSMKSGEVMPRAVVTLHHRSSNAPVTLVVTFGHVVLVKYDLSVDVSDTMADMKESWTATYETVDYVYKNRPLAKGSDHITTGTARVFKMKKTVLF